MMAVTLDDFCSYILVPLLLLGLWCLFEGGQKKLLILSLVMLTGQNMQRECILFIISSEITILGGRFKSWHLPYRLTEVPWNMAEVATYDYP